MKVAVSDLEGSALDWAVAMAEGLKPEDIYISHSILCRRLRDENGELTGRYQTGPDLIFHRKWEAAGPIIVREGISTYRKHHGFCIACIYDLNDEETFMHCHEQLLVAAMRCYVESKLADVVDVPEELLK